MLIDLYISLYKPKLFCVVKALDALEHQHYYFILDVLLLYCIMTYKNIYSDLCIMVVTTIYIGYSTNLTSFDLFTLTCILHNNELSSSYI